MPEKSRREGYDYEAGECEMGRRPDSRLHHRVRRLGGPRRRLFEIA